MKINDDLRNILLPAYAPCESFSGACTSMIWNPGTGQIPRGFCGATGGLAEVRLLLVCAEPGDPHQHESHSGSTPSEYLNSAYAYAWGCFANGKDQFHRNIRYVLDLCFPQQHFAEQMRRTLIIDAVLCSAEREGAKVIPIVELQCARLYLINIIHKLPNASIVALGRKAQTRLKKVGVPGFISTFAAAPPGCNFRGAQESWRMAAKEVQNKR